MGETRYAIMPGSTMNKKTGNGTCGRNYEGAFMELDRYYPVVRVYDEDGFMIAGYYYDGGMKDMVCT